MPVIRIERFNYGPAVPKEVQGTFGVLTMPDGKTLWSVERAWRQNEPGVSCIPEGVYPLRKRASFIVQRTSGGEFHEGWEVAGVPDRSSIMIHPATWPTELGGGIGVGERYGVIDGRLAVQSSLFAFRELMSALDADEYELQITPYLVTYP